MTTAMQRFPYCTIDVKFISDLKRENQFLSRDMGVYYMIGVPTRSVNQF